MLEKTRKIVSQKGFLLIEAMIALVVLVTVCIGLTNWYCCIIRYHYEAQNRLEALLLVNSCIEKNMIEGFFPEYYSEQRGIFTLTSKVYVDEYLSGQGLENNAFEVAATWIADNGIEHSVVMHSSGMIPISKAG